MQDFRVAPTRCGSAGFSSDLLGSRVKR